MKVKLTNGLVIEGTKRENEKALDKIFFVPRFDFPPLQDLIETYHACEICPLRPLCNDNNEFDCQTSGMFAGFHVGEEDAIEYMMKKDKEGVYNE